MEQLNEIKYVRLIKKYSNGTQTVISVTEDAVDYLLEYYPEKYELVEEEGEGEEGEGGEEPRRRRGRPPKNVSQDEG